ncbi:protein lin-54 homolog [Hermetia illucens]|uniref:protein lin-54 homolog n=1 Tax=Hermetia illucens TaxID=343691 RepID=UPI0018CC4D1B|nr:protein lin-54 homolog [Hermetia illucens]
MANIVTTSSLSSTVLSPTEINIEDLISVSGINDSPTEETAIKSASDSSLPRKNTDEASTSAESPSTSIPTSSDLEQLPQQKVVSLAKIIPKQTATSTISKIPTTVTASNSGQVVIIQGPSGPLPVRIAGSSAASNKVGVTVSSSLNPTGTMVNAKTTVTSPKDSPTTKSQPVTIQVLKMPDGSLVPIKNNKALNLTNLSNISQLNVGSGRPVIVKTSNGSKTVIGAQTKISPGAPVLKSLTLAEAQKAGFIKPKSLDLPSMNKLQKILPSPSPTTPTAPSITSTTTTSTASTKEITIKSETDGSTKQIVVPQHMLKLQSSGAIQAIQIPGKPGLQYVRVLSNTAASTAKTVSAAVKKESSPTKSQPPQRVVINSSGKPSVSIVSSNKESTSTTTKGNVRVISTVPTLRKIQDPSVTKLISTPQTDSEATASTTQLQIRKVNHTNLNNNNSEPKLLNAQIASGTYGKSSASSHQVVRKIVPAEQRTSTSTSDEPPRTKQYSTLKSPPLQMSLKTSPEFTEEQISMLFGKRSPTPEALRRKHCNCTKSQCLKLYCDCFANGEFCQDCNCKECYNNLEYEDERQKAIKICLERNPNAFKPKITKAKDQSDLRLHNKGCNCKRSGCLKNYCECYEAKIACSSNCKCFGCRNVEDRSERDRFEDPQGQTVQPTERTRAPKRPHDEVLERPSMSSASSSLRLQDGQPPNKQPYNFITQDVVDATIQCMIAQVDECKKNGMSNKITERMIIEELGRCLVEIIDFSIRNMDN